MAGNVRTHCTYLSSKRVQFYLSVKPAGSMTVLVLVRHSVAPSRVFLCSSQIISEWIHVCERIEVAKTRGSKCRSIKGTNVYLRLTNNNNLGTSPPVPLRSPVAIRRRRKRERWKKKNKEIKLILYIPPI